MPAFLLTLCLPTHSTRGLPAPQSESDPWSLSVSSESLSPLVHAHWWALSPLVHALRLRDSQRLLSANLRYRW
eukprot:3939710-Rhodomonas_salina.3